MNELIKKYKNKLVVIKSALFSFGGIEDFIYDKTVLVIFDARQYLDFTDKIALYFEYKNRYGYFIMPIKKLSNYIEIINNE